MVFGRHGHFEVDLATVDNGAAMEGNHHATLAAAAAALDRFSSYATRRCSRRVQSRTVSR